MDVKSMDVKPLLGDPGLWKSVVSASIVVCGYFLVSSCGAADLTGESKKRSKPDVSANQAGIQGLGSDDSVEQYGTNADGTPCLKFLVDQPGQNPGQNNPGQNPGKGPGSVQPGNPGKGPNGDGREPAPVPPCGPTQFGKGGSYGPHNPRSDVDVSVDINKNGYGPNPPGQNGPCIGPLCVFVGVGVGKGGSSCQGAQCPPPPPPGPGVPPPPPGECQGGGHGKIWGKWSHWKKGTC